MDPQPGFTMSAPTRPPENTPGAFRPAGLPQPVRKLLLALVVPAALLIGLELTLRMAGYHHPIRSKILAIPDKISGFIGTREFHLGTVMSPPGYLWRTQANTEFTDRHGFRLPALPYVKEPGKTRVAFLGGSTTQGGYRPYPERAIRLLNEVAGSNRFEALNVACSSYATHQSLLVLDRWVFPRKPDVVFIYHGWNDVKVAPDGYADHRKDRLVGRDGQPRTALPAWVTRWRITEALAGIANRLGPAWPEQRVPFNRFEANLEALVEACRSKGIRVILMTRPGEASSRLDLPPLKPGTPAFLHAVRTHGTDDPAIVYQRAWLEAVARQRAVAARHPQVALFDGAAVLTDLADRAAAGYFGENVPMFHADHIHLHDFAEELLAQQVAIALEPGMSAAVSNRIAGVDYLHRLARELLAEDSPREAAWCLGEALRQNPGAETVAALEADLQRARLDFEFADLFRAGRWGSADRDFESKLSKLKRCLAIRPADFGVMAQLYRVGKYMGREDAIAEAIAPFQPGSAEERRLQLSAMLESHLAAGRRDSARTVAEQLLKINPGDTLAASVINPSDR